ncbi:MAG: AzlD domain-containing protein [Alphaproteobacteria bacterium]|nr:AzlD domain-containing protein [Alphaproteobacteria bacterium]
MDQGTVTLTILGMAVLTLAIKVVPVVALARRRLPPLLLEALRHLPIAVMSAMTVQLVAVSAGRLNFAADNLSLWLTIPTVAVAALSRNLFVTIAAGLALVALGRQLLA